MQPTVGSVFALHNKSVDQRSQFQVSVAHNLSSNSLFHQRTNSRHYMSQDRLPKRNLVNSKIKHSSNILKRVAKNGANVRGAKKNNYVFPYVSSQEVQTHRQKSSDYGGRQTSGFTIFKCLLKVFEVFIPVMGCGIVYWHRL